MFTARVGWRANLVELAVAAVEDELDGHVRAVLDAADVLCREVEGEAEAALAGGLEERHDVLERVIHREVVEAVRVLHGSDDAADYTKRISQSVG